jgi:transcriptional regulator with XRE-family HTH domain
MDEASDGERLGVAIRALREGRGEPRPSLAHRAGVTPAWLSRIERGRIKNPTRVTVDAVAQALGFRTANDLLRMFYGHDAYARRRPRGYRRFPD